MNDSSRCFVISIFLRYSIQRSNTHRGLIDALDVVLVGAGYQFHDVLVAVFGAPVQCRLQQRKKGGAVIIRWSVV